MLSGTPTRDKEAEIMAMDLAKQSFAYEPEYLIAGTNIPIETKAMTSASALALGAPVIIDANGKAAKLQATESSGSYSVDTSALYGIAAEAASAANKPVMVYLTGEFFADKLELEDNVTVADIDVAFRKLGIFLK